MLSFSKDIGKCKDNGHLQGTGRPLGDESRTEGYVLGHWRWQVSPHGVLPR